MALKPKKVHSLDQLRSMQYVGLPGPVKIVRVGQLQHAGAMVELMEKMGGRGWRIEGAVVVKRLARADALLVSIANELLPDFIDHPRGPNVERELRRFGWKLTNISRIHGHRTRMANERAPKQEVLNQLGYYLRRLALKSRTRSIASMVDRLRALRDKLIPATRAMAVRVTPPPPGGAAGGSDSPSSSSSGSSDRSSTPPHVPGSSGSDSSYNPDCEDCVEGRPHNAC